MRNQTILTFPDGYLLLGSTGAWYPSFLVFFSEQTRPTDHLSSLHFVKFEFELYLEIEVEGPS